MPTILAAMGLSFLISHEVEWLFTGVAVSLGLIALHLGWRQHGSRLVVSTLAVGIIGLLVARGLEAGGPHGEHEAAPVPVTVSADVKMHTQNTETTHDPQTGHHDEGHVATGLLGVLAGLILCLGHILNIREWRRSVRHELAPASDTHC